MVSKRVFSRVDYSIFYKSVAMGTAKASGKISHWLKKKYFEQHGTSDWCFFGETCDDEGQPQNVRLYCTPVARSIKRHVKVKGEANPYDPAFAATCKAAGYDCLTKEEWIKPRISLRVAYEVGAARQQTVRSPRTMYPHSQEWHQNREATVYLPA